MRNKRIAFLLCAGVAAGTASGAAFAGPGAPPRHLLVQVRDTPPQGPAAIRHGADGSYSLSTGSGADRDDRGALAPDNATVLSTSNRLRRVHLVEGERVRVDLPAVQSLQFHLSQSSSTSTSTGKGAAAPTGGARGAAGSSASSAPAGAGSTGSTGSTGNASGSGSAGASGAAVSGVVYFEAVSAFAARFTVAGPAVHIELTPLRRGGVAAPYAAGAAGADAPVTITGRLGEWIALGDTDLGDTAKSLSVTADPASPASVWVRVDLETARSLQ
jgi:hypothetical protein